MTRCLPLTQPVFVLLLSEMVLALPDVALELLHLLLERPQLTSRSRSPTRRVKRGPSGTQQRGKVSGGGASDGLARVLDAVSGLLNPGSGV